MVPSFLTFKIFNRSLYMSEFYQQAIEDLLSSEIEFKKKALKKLKIDAIPLELAIKSRLSILDFLIVKHKLNIFLNSCKSNIPTNHKSKLDKINVQSSSFDFIFDVILNYSTYNLSKNDKFLLSLGLDFRLQCLKPRFVEFLLPFEQLVFQLKSLGNHTTFNNLRRECTVIAHKAFSSSQRFRFFSTFFLNTLTSFRFLNFMISIIWDNLPTMILSSLQNLIRVKVLLYLTNLIIFLKSYPFYLTNPNFKKLMTIQIISV